MEKHGQVIEDILDSLSIESRKGEESYSVEEPLFELKEQGNLDKVRSEDREVGIDRTYENPN